MVRKRMSLPQAMCNNALGKKLMGNGGAGRVREQRKKTAQGTNGNGTAPGTVPANEQFQFIQQPTATTSLFDSHQIAALFPCSPPSSSSASPCSSSSSADNVRAIPQNVPSSYRHGATPPRQSPRKEFPAAEQHKRAPTEQNGTSSSTFAATANNGAKLRNYPMVAMPSSATAKEVIAFCQRRQCPPALEELENLVHENLDRCHSEQILGPLNLGAHLLRRRPDRNLALSLRAKEGVLHIKLEFHDGQWILGDGPRFSTVHGMLRAYRRTELPVRGAEQIRLGVLLKPSDIPGGLLLL